MAGIYLIEKDGNLVELIERAYDSEGYLQELLARYPSLLAGDQMDSVEPRRWISIAREIGIAGRLLFRCLKQSLKDYVADLSPMSDQDPALRRIVKAEQKMAIISRIHDRAC